MDLILKPLGKVVCLLILLFLTNEQFGQTQDTTALNFTTNGSGQDKKTFPKIGLFWFNNSYIFQNVRDKYTSEFKNVVTATIDLGIDWGNYNDKLKPDQNNSLWNYNGIGLGVEYRIQSPNKEKLDSFLMNFNHPWYLNIRYDGAIGKNMDGWFLNSLSLHYNLGYNTNFLYHYFRPGLGIGFDFNDLCVFEFGYEKFFHLQKQINSESAHAYYIKVNYYLYL
jgi:hypothetical protein